MTTRYVRETNGHWEVLREGERRGVTRAESIDKALAQARAIVRKHGGGEVHVINDVGKIERSSHVGRPRRKRSS